MMKNNYPIDLLSQIANFIAMYTCSTPGASSGEVAEKIKDAFYIHPDDAEKISALLAKEMNLHKLGLAAVELNLTFNCNLTCDYCFIRKKNPRDRMTFSTAKNAIDLLMSRAAYPTVNITLIGGEPLLEFELIKQIVPYALESAMKRNLGVSWAVTTNGTLINEKILEFFARYNINMMVSIDGGPENHDRYRKTKSGEGSWQKIVDLIPLIKRYQPWLGGRMTVSTEAIDTMREDFQRLMGLGFNQLIIAPAQGADCWSIGQIKQYGLKLVGILQDYHQLKQKGFSLHIDEFEKMEDSYPGWGCRAGVTSLAVAPNGDLSPCSKLLGLTDEAARWIVGNVNNEIDVKLLEPFQNAISRQPKHCGRCSRKCTGGCYAVNFEQTGDHFTPSEEMCLFWVVMEEVKHLSGVMRFCGTRCPGCKS